MGEGNARFYIMQAYFSVGSIMSILWLGFEEAGLSKASAYALAFSCIWYLLALSHTATAFRLARKIDEMMGWETDSNAN